MGGRGRGSLLDQVTGSGDRSGSVQKEITPPQSDVCSCWNAVDLAAEEVLPCVSGQWNHVSRISDLLPQHGQGRWHHTWHLTPSPSPSFVFPLHHFPSPSSSLQEMKLSLWVLPPSLFTTHRHLGLRKWKLCPRLLHSFPSPPPTWAPLLLLLATTSPGRSHAEPMSLARPSGLWRVKMDRNTRSCG